MNPKRRQTDSDRAQHAQAQLDQALSRAKRAMTSVDLWRGRVKYYNARVAGELKRVRLQHNKAAGDRHARAIDLE